MSRCKLLEQVATLISCFQMAALLGRRTAESESVIGLLKWSGRSPSPWRRYLK